MIDLNIGLGVLPWHFNDIVLSGKFYSEIIGSQICVDNRLTECTTNVDTQVDVIECGLKTSRDGFFYLAKVLGQ